MASCDQYYQIDPDGVGSGCYSPHGPLLPLDDVLLCHSSLPPEQTSSWCLISYSVPCVKLESLNWVSQRWECTGVWF